MSVHTAVAPTVTSPLVRLGRALVSLVGVVLHPLGMLMGCTVRSLRTAERLDRGLVLVLPGIEGQSFLNQSLARGLAEAGLKEAIEIHDWTTHVILLFLVHLRWTWWHNRSIVKLVKRIRDYRESHPGRPIYLVGHSGGGALLVHALQDLPQDCSVTGAILLGPALSTQFNLAPALRHVEQGLWNFHSPLDCVFLGMGTLLCGTFDGRHSLSGGNRGFTPPPNVSPEDRELYSSKLHQEPFRAEMMGSYNFGGHMGWTNRVFAAEWLAPIIDPQLAAPSPVIPQESLA